jgi:predicted Zn-dependent peptidase
MSETARVHTLANGLTLIAEPMPWLKSAAFTVLLPAGTCREPEGLQGLCGITVELAQRGAGPNDSRQIVEALDSMGVERSCAASTFHTSFSASMPADSLVDSLAIYGDFVQRPHLPEDEIEDSRQTALQELLSLEDDPSQKVFTELKKLRYGSIHGRSPYGSMEGIEKVTLDDVQEFWKSFYIPNGAILAIAGNFAWDKLVGDVERIFSEWQPGKAPLRESVVVNSVSHHIPHESSQTHIALAYNCVPYSHADFYESRGLVSVLSDGMSSRLFTEVREKRGLVYSISASSQTIGDRGSVLTYAGTTGGRAQETLDVTIATIRSLEHGVDAGELSRLKARVKSALVMEQESSSSRSSQIASDWHYLRRVVPRREVMEKIENLTSQSLLAHLQRYPPSGWSLVSMGPEEVNLPDGI